MTAYGLHCPDEPAHGRLLDWPTERFGFFCPHQGHGGNGAFFTTAEAESPTPSSSVDRPAQDTGGLVAPRRDQRSSPAPVFSLRPPSEDPAT